MIINLENKIIKKATIYNRIFELSDSYINELEKAHLNNENKNKIHAKFKKEFKKQCINLEKIEY